MAVEISPPEEMLEPSINEENEEIETSFSEEIEKSTFNLKDNPENDEEKIKEDAELIFNGYNMLEGKEETVDCRMGPNRSGLYINI